MDSINLREIEHWIDCKTTDLVEVLECDPDTALSVIQEFLASGLLPPQYPLLFKDFGFVTAAMVLSDPEKYDGKLLCDPCCYNYHSGHDEAILNWINGLPVIRSSTGMTYAIASGSRETKRGINE